MQQKLLSCAQLCSLTSVLSLFSLSLSFPLSRCVSNTQVEWTQKFVGDFGAQRLLTFSTWLAAFCFDFTAAAYSPSLSLSLYLCISLTHLHVLCTCFACVMYANWAAHAPRSLGWRWLIGVSTHKYTQTPVHTYTWVVCREASRWDRSLRVCIVNWRSHAVICISACFTSICQILVQPLGSALALQQAWLGSQVATGVARISAH